jgi:hypothetical protein
MSKPLKVPDVRNTRKTASSNKETSSAKGTKVSLEKTSSIKFARRLNPIQKHKENFMKKPSTKTDIDTTLTNELKTILQKKAPNDMKPTPLVSKAKSSDRRFPKGVSGNPSGRPFGNQNTSTRIDEQLLEGEAEELSRLPFAFLLNGDIHALRALRARHVRMTARALAILEGDALRKLARLSSKGAQADSAQSCRQIAKSAALSSRTERAEQHGPNHNEMIL